MQPLFEYRKIHRELLISSYNDILMIEPDNIELLKAYVMVILDNSNTDQRIEFLKSINSKAVDYIK